MKLVRVTWQSVYDQLWLKFNSKEFTFEDSLAVIFNKKRFDAKEIKYGYKLVNEMEDNGYIIHRKADYDQRVRLYRLLRPEMVSNAWAIFKKVFRKGKGFTLKDLIEEADKSAKWDYMYIKDTAIWFWTNEYRSSDVRYMSVSRDVVDGWISLFKLFGSSVVVDNIIVSEAKEASEVVSLHTDLDTRVHKHGKNHMQLAEYTIIDAFKDNDLLGALAVLIVQKNKLNWSQVVDVAKSSGLINTLGFSLDCINFQAHKEVFSKELIDKIRKYKQKESEIIKGIERSEEINLSYRPLEEKWNVKCLQADAFPKAVLDLVR